MGGDGTFIEHEHLAGRDEERKKERPSSLNGSVAEEAAGCGVRKQVEPHTSLFAHGAHLDVIDRPAGGEDRADARFDQNLGAVLEREEAVAVGHGALGIVSGVARSLDREFATADAILLAHGVGQQLALVRERDGIRVRRGADAPGQDEVVLFLTGERASRRVEAWIPQVQNERLAVLADDPAAHGPIRDLFDQASRELGERGIDEHSAEALCPLEHVGRIVREFGGGDTAENALLACFHPMRAKDVRARSIEREVRDHRRAVDGEGVALDHLP